MRGIIYTNGAKTNGIWLDVLGWFVRPRFQYLVGYIDHFNDTHFECDDCGGIFSTEKMQKVFELIPHSIEKTFDDLEKWDTVFKYEYCKHCARPGNYYTQNNSGKKTYYNKNDKLVMV